MRKFIAKGVSDYDIHEDKSMEIWSEEMGDEYHTIHELYQHRMALTIALMKQIEKLNNNIVFTLEAYRSKNHHPDGEPMFPDYFIVWIQKGKDMIISYHYNLKYWDKFNFLQELEYPPKWDGHTPKDVVERLMEI